jgi:hypothetical protein
VALGGFMFTWYRKRQHPALAVVHTSATPAESAKEAPEVDPTPGYSGRRRAGSREPDGGKERGDTAGGKPDDDGFVVI